MKTKTAVFLPAKGTSSRIANKNVQLMDGKPLFLHTLEKLFLSDIFDEIWLDTESDELAALADHIPCRRLHRIQELASNLTDGNQLFLNEVKSTEADIVMQVLGTSPFIEISTMARAIEILKTRPEYDSVVLINRQKQYTWSEGRPQYPIHRIPNSVDLPDTLIETMGLYAIRREAALKTGRRVGERPYLLDSTPIEAIDVNWPDDFALANRIAAGLREENRRLLNNIKVHLSSAILSDVMDDLGIREDQMIVGLHQNLPGRKIFGHAKTLRLRKIEDGEDFRGIYDALESYNTVIPNDIIMVENQTPEFAYFGELNANLAIRSGAIGAVIGGKTRDSEAVGALDFPTFSTGYVGRDVRRRAVTDTINRPIEIFNVPVKPGDLVFGDAEGVIVIPLKFEQKVLDEVFRRLKAEKNILFDIASGADIQALTNRHGNF